MKPTQIAMILATSISSMTLEATTSIAFEIPTHREITDRSITAGISLLDILLKNFWFEFEDGVLEEIADGKDIRLLILEGSVNEDCCLVRSRHHFHNPRLAWDEAGWRPPPLNVELGESSVIWSQNENQFIGGKHSWKDARESYYQALTATSKSERMDLFAETFRSLGHLIHLVQDAATPSHTRNDTHIGYGSIGDPDGFHVWAKSDTATALILSATPSPLSTSLFDQANPNGFAPIPVSRIIDSTDGDIGTLALTPGLNIGIAEYSSANFFSDDTINSPNFLSPLSSQVDVGAPELDNSGTRLRRYLYFGSSPYRVGDFAWF